MLGACGMFVKALSNFNILPSRCVNLFNPHDNPVRQAGWISIIFIDNENNETAALRGGLPK